jgi:hypothetical protein
MKRATMGPDEYRRLHAVCLDLADQSNVADVRLRWLTMAQGWIELANELPQGQPTRLADSNVILLRRRQKSGAGGDLPLSFHPSAVRVLAVVAVRPNFGSPAGGVFRLSHGDGLAAPT